MSELGRRQDMYLQHAAAEREATKAADKLFKDTKAAYARLEKELKKLTDPKRLGSLTVTWMQDGEEMSIGPTPAAMTGPEFMAALGAVQRSVAAKLTDRDRIEEVRGEMRAMPQKYKKQRRELETKIYRAQVRQQKAIEGLSSEQAQAIRQIAEASIKT